MIDFHVHLYSADDLPANQAQFPYVLPEPHPVKDYLDRLIDLGMKPRLVNNVHLSILPDSENVFRAFNTLAELKSENIERYGDIEMIGTILACPQYATPERLNHPQIKGIRFVLHDADPESISPESYSTPDWQSLYARLRADQHIHIYAQEPEANLRVLRQLPEDQVVIIDHLGTCRANRGVKDPAYKALLDEAKKRGNVFFKGPGYRTANTPEEVLPFTKEIVKRLGADRLILEASDAPHVGLDASDHPYKALFTPESALEFTLRLAKLTAEHSDLSYQTVLNAACNKIINPSEEKNND